VTYEWMAGGFFLIQRVNLLQEDGTESTGMEVIGHERGLGAGPSADVKSRVYGGTGETLDYTYELGGTPSPYGSGRGGRWRTTGALLVRTGTCSFEDTTTPKVSTTTPTGKGIGRGSNIAATFSEAMDAATINGTTFKLLKTGSTNNVRAAFAYNAASQKAILNPNKRLAAGTKYKAVVTTGAEDLAGNALDQDPTTAGDQQKTWTFVTKR
jgi:hypothetical protein